MTILLVGYLCRMQIIKKINYLNCTKIILNVCNTTEKFSIISLIIFIKKI